jgi:DNA-directed RNA polymerase subunit RPC12/RpoP
MGTTVRCGNCGEQVEVDPACRRPRRVHCPACGTRLSVPAALEGMPRLHTPAPDVPAMLAQAPVIPPAGPHAAEHAEESPARGGARPAVAMLAGAMPMLLSMCLHAGALLILVWVLTIVSALTQRPRDGGEPTPPGASLYEERSWATPLPDRDPGDPPPRRIWGLDRGGDVSFLGCIPKGKVCYVIFVIDKGGSMVGSFDEIRTQLIDSVCRLKEPQQFHVVFFSGDKCEQLQPRRMVTATSDNTRAAVRALSSVHATGFGSSPIPALEMAFRTLRNTPYDRGKVLFLLTDGEFDSSGYEYRGPDGRPLVGNQAVIQWLRANNKSGGVHVYPIIMGPRPSADIDASLEFLAQENNGRHKYVSNAN